MIRESELEEMRKSVEQATNVNLAHEIEHTIDPAGELQKGLEPPSPSPPPSTATAAEPSSPTVGAPAPAPEPPAPDAAISPPPAKSGTHD